VYRLVVLLGLVAACKTEGSPSEPPVGMPPLGEPPANTVGSFSIQLPEQQLAPGAETSPCWVFPIELTGPSKLVGGAVLRTMPGLHHGNITSRPKTGEGIRRCEPGSGNEGTDIINGGMVLFGSSTQKSGDEWYRFPDGEGYRIREGFEIVARMHYLNPTDEPLTVAPKYEWFTIDESKIVHELGPFLWMYQKFSIPPRATHTASADCYLPNDHPSHIVTMLPHMHQLGRALTGAYIGGPHDGHKFLDSQGYNPDDGVLVQYEPPVDLTEAQGVRFECTWQNTFDKTIVEGIGDDEMCMVFGYAWPVNKAYTLVAEPDNCIMFPTPPPPGG
jgi:hypothetical protein